MGTCLCTAPSIPCQRSLQGLESTHVCVRCQCTSRDLEQERPCSSDRATQGTGTGLTDRHTGWPAGNTAPRHAGERGAWATMQHAQHGIKAHINFKSPSGSTSPVFAEPVRPPLRADAGAGARLCVRVCGCVGLVWGQGFRRSPKDATTSKSSKGMYQSCSR